MNFFEIDYTQAATKLLKEAFSFKKYKAMSGALAVFTGIFMLLFVVADLLAAAWTYLLGFFFNIIKAPILSLHTIVNNEGKETKHATQAIIYLISWPLVFLLYAISALTLIWLNVSYFVLVVITYIWSLGGFKFHFYAKDVGCCGIEVAEKYNSILPTVYVLVNSIASIVFWLVAPICATSLYCALYVGFESFGEIFPYYFGYFDTYLIWLIPFILIFSVLYSLLGFAPRPKTVAKK